MYGMIHRCIRQMVIDRSGQEAWDEIESRLGTGPEHLVSAQVYDDELTISIVAAVADWLGCSIAEALTAFGRYWIRFAERGSYGAMLDFTGRDIATFIANLDRMHQAVQAAMPDARVPSFRLVESTPHQLLVQYRSEREGLEPFVLGLMEGLLDRFETEGVVDQVPGEGAGSRFRIRFTAPARK